MRAWFALMPHRCHGFFSGARDVETPKPAEDVETPALAEEKVVENPMPAEDVEKLAPAEEPPVVSYALEQLTDPKVWQKLGIPSAARERSLDDATFQEIFGMDKQAFAKLAKWKQDNLKKKVGLF